MKKNIFAIFCLTVVSAFVFAQDIQWSKKIVQPNRSVNKALITDKNNVVYSYGSYSPSSLTDTSGSFLQSYTGSGALLLSKRWKIPFAINEMVYDGDQHFYFTASFLGTQVIDGITIASRGFTDAVAGKMDLTGQIVWMKTFGGNRVDEGNGICFNSTDNSIYVTGSVRDSLFLNNTFHSKNQQSAIVLHYSSLGSLVKHKLYDFTPERDFTGNINSGREILRNSSGDLFLLMDRDGHFWDGPDTVSFPIMGRYLFKLTSNLDTVWSTYINGPACYYGWNASSITLAASGDIYLESFCSVKYGGTGEILRINGTTGQISWTYSNNDGGYSDIFLDGNTVFVIGNEGANGCPCPESSPGYYVVKKFDQNNAVVGETRFAGVVLYNIVKDAVGNIFVVGDFHQRYVIIAADTIWGDSVSTPYPSYYGRFLTKLGDINCTPPIISVSVPSQYGGKYYSICSGDTARLTLNLSQGGTFNWSNGATGTQTNVYTTGLYRVLNTQANGCKAYSLPVDIRVNGDTPGAIYGNTTVCSGSIQTYSIAAVFGAGSYNWTLPSGWTGSSTTNKIQATVGTFWGNISVTASSPCGISQPRTIAVAVSASSPSTPGTISGNNTVCSSIITTYSVAAVLGVTSYSWSLPSTWTGTSTTNFINVNVGSVGGNISVNASNACGSSAVQSKSVTVSNIDNTVTQMGFTLNANMSGVNYQWIDCANSNAVISSETNQSYTPSISGNFAVIVTGNGCSDTSSCTNVIITGIPDNSETSSLLIYPNPINNVVYVKYKSSETNSTFELTINNILGQAVYTSSVPSFQGEYAKTIDLSKVKPGDYFMQIATDKKKIVRKISVY